MAARAGERQSEAANLRLLWKPSAAASPAPQPEVPKPKLYVLAVRVSLSKALIEGLSGKADISGKGAITISELEYWLAERVKTLTGGKQHPTTAKPETIRDFPVAAVR